MPEDRAGVPAPRCLFVPVSGRFGMGEYARSLAIARGVQARWPGAQIHFLLSREAPYAANQEFPRTLLPSSPTHHTGAVVAAIAELRPNIVIFDNAGRSAQLRAARRAGAGVIYISSRRRQRRKAFRWRWMGLLDEHWIAYPQFLAGALGRVERLKLRLRGRPVVRYLDAMVAADEPQRATAVFRDHGLEENRYVLLVPGAGTGHPDATGASEAFTQAARALDLRGHRCVLIAPGDRQAGDSDTLVWLPRQESGTLHALMRRAALVVSNGGATMLQALACDTAVLAVPIAGDQDERIRHCVVRGLVRRAEPAAAAIDGAADALLSDAPARELLRQRARALQLRDGVETAVRACESLLQSARSHGSSEHAA
jgi:hypothetical protein